MIRRPFGDTEASVYQPSARSWSASDAVIRVLLALVLLGLAAGWFEPEFWR